MNKYICHYQFTKNETKLCVNEKYATSGIFDFSEGFWVNEQFEFTKSSDAKYWIPPCRIYYIEKVEVEQDTDET
jgi:hypothetical protein